MNSIRRWLGGELWRVRVAERQLAVKRVHLTTLIAVAIVAAAVGLIVGFGAGFHYPYRTLPAPKVPPGQTQPSCPSPGKITRKDDHSLGQCLPKPTVENAALITASQTGPDFSNNTPVYGDAAWSAIARRSAFAIFKVNESVSFIDRTAGPMAALARRHGLIVGGYDFLHVCLVDAAGEARVGVSAARAAGVIGKGALALTGDAEYPPSPQCNARAWISTWVATVHSLTGRWPTIYTGGWWWNPHVGAWWYGNLLAWVSGYVSSLSRVPRPGSRSRIDLWQLTDHGFNGATSGDLSRWLDGASAFAAATGGSSSSPPSSTARYAVLPATVFRFGTVSASERNTVRTWDASHCRNPVRRPVCRSSRAHLVLLRDRIWFVAHHVLVFGPVSFPKPPQWVPVRRARWSYPNRRQPLGSRFQLISLRLAQH